MTRRAFASPGYQVPIEGFSQVVAAPPGATTLYTSGLTARGADGDVVAVGDLEGQTRQVMENMRNVLAAAGATLDDVVRIRTYVVDIGRWDEIERVWREYWGEQWPASTLVEIARLFDERQLIEMEAVAVLSVGAEARHQEVPE